MKTTRRSAIFGSLATAAGVGAAGQSLTGCSSGEAPPGSPLTKVTVIGVLHGPHRRSKTYSLDVPAQGG